MYSVNSWNSFNFPIAPDEFKDIFEDEIFYFLLITEASPSLHNIPNPQVVCVS